MTVRTHTQEPVTAELDRSALDFTPWRFWADADDERRDRQLALQAELCRERGYVLGERCFVSGSVEWLKPSTDVCEPIRTASPRRTSPRTTVYGLRVQSRPARRLPLTYAPAAT